MRDFWMSWYELHRRSPDDSEFAQAQDELVGWLEEFAAPLAAVLPDEYARIMAQPFCSGNNSSKDREVGQAVEVEARANIAVMAAVDMFEHAVTQHILLRFFVYVSFTAVGVQDSVLVSGQGVNLKGQGTVLVSGYAAIRARRCRIGGDC